MKKENILAFTSGYNVPKFTICTKMTITINRAR